MNRRSFLSTLVVPLAKAQPRTPESNASILEAVWRGARDRFYDPGMRAVDWNAVRAGFLPKARACTTNEQLLAVLPFHFDPKGRRAFVRYALVGNNGVTLARLEPIKDNPNFGLSKSEAKLRIRRAGRLLDMSVKRVARPNGFKIAVAEHPRSEIVHLRFFALDTRSVPMAELRQLWQDAMPAKGLILDLRNCFGGDARVAGFIASSLLGPGKQLFRNVPRPGSGDQELTEHTDSGAPRFAGRVALITNSSTESGPELFAAICKEGVGTLHGPLHPVHLTEGKRLRGPRCHA